MVTTASTDVSTANMSVHWLYLSIGHTSRPDFELAHSLSVRKTHTHIQVRCDFAISSAACAHTHTDLWAIHGWLSCTHTVPPHCQHTGSGDQACAFDRAGRALPNPKHHWCYGFYGNFRTFLFPFSAERTALRINF